MTAADLWPRIESLLAEVERPARYIDREWGARHDDGAAYRSVLVYPDTYEIGQANQALAILYDVLNRAEGIAAERAYVPWVDMAALMRERDLPLFSLESCSPVRDFDFVGITLPHELSYTNVLETLDLAGIPLRSIGRTEGDPLVVGGGPGAYNPEPVAAFFDAVVIGEGEQVVLEVVDVHRRAKARRASRTDLLRDLAKVEGVYVPSLYAEERGPGGSFRSVVPQAGAPGVVRKRVLPDMSLSVPQTCGIVPFVDVVHDRYALEILRGCTRGCRFCQAGMVYRPVRERTADDIVKAVLDGVRCTGYDEVSLTSLSSTDHSQLADVLTRLKRRLAGSGVSVSLPSLRVDAFGVEMARLVSAGKKSGLTFAPEAGTQRLRDVINKNVTEDDLIGSVERAFSAGWRRVKLYFMIGLPTETDEDIAGIGELVGRTLAAARAAAGDSRGSVRVAVSVSTFVPKVQTPFQWDAQIPLEEVRRRQGILRDSMPRKGVDLHWHDPEVSLLEGVMARGGRELADAIEHAWRDGAAFDAWTERFSLTRWLRAFEAVGVDAEQIANRERDLDEPLPWEHLSAGLSREYLRGERERGYAGKTTPDCSFAGCTGCDVCDELGVEVVLGGDSRG